MLALVLVMWLWPAQQTGGIVGAVLDAATGQSIRNVRITVEQSPGVEAISDLDGIFRLELPPGKYKLRFTADNFRETTVDAVEVLAGRIVEATTVMTGRASGTTVDVVEKIGAAVATAEAMVLERKLASVVSDSVSAEEIRQTVASDAAGVLEKVTGVSIVDSGYVYVRGLGERYSATMLNNAILPTTEPERRVVPLDLFPASLIDNIKVLKSYSPDLPGEFSAGLVQLRTVEFPSSRTLKAGFSNGFNTLTTFKPSSTYPGGSKDFFGFDDGSRSIPSVIPHDKRLFPGSFTPAEFQNLGRSFPVNWEPTRIESTRPSIGYSISGGDTFGRIGLVGAFTFSNSLQNRNEIQKYYRVSGNKPIVFTDYPDFNVSNESVRMGGVANVALRLSGSNKLILRNTLTRDTDKEARRIKGYNGGVDGVVDSTRLRWVERGLYSTSLEGEHAFAGFGNSLLKWQYTYSRSTRDEPDLRDIVRGEQADGSFTFLSLPQSGTRFYNNLRDRIHEPLIEWSKPLYRGGFSAVMKFGYRGTFRARNFEGRLFRFLAAQANTIDFKLPSNQLLGLDNIRPDRFVVRENTRGTDTYNATMDTHGAFAMMDAAIGSRWRLSGGVRFEDSNVVVETIDPLVPGAVPAIARLQNRDPLPAVNVVYALTTRQNLRFGYGRTLSRPDFRELSPFEFTNVLGGFNTVGNPNLKRASIDNYDVRWEWFHGGDQVIAASYFGKQFTDPIEVTVQPTTDLRQSFINAKNATNQGAEFEFRRNLRFISEGLAQFSLQANMTLVDSNVTLPELSTLLLTSRIRPMVGQSRYIYNLIIDWNRPQWRSDARFYVNTVSRRITDVGTFGLPDIYQEGNTFLDFAYQRSFGAEQRWSFRMTGENLGDTHYLWTQAGLPQRSYRAGRTFSAGISLSIF
jgi:outer membrane receptor protein involved in Fe transport